MATNKSAYNILDRTELVVNIQGPFGLSGEGGELERSKVELTENKLLLGQFYSTLLYSTPPPSLLIQTDQLVTKLHHTRTKDSFFFSFIGKLCMHPVGHEPKTSLSTQHLQGKEVLDELELIGSTKDSFSAIKINKCSKREVPTACVLEKIGRAHV